MNYRKTALGTAATSPQLFKKKKQKPKQDPDPAYRRTNTHGHARAQEHTSREWCDWFPWCHEAHWQGWSVNMLKDNREDDGGEKKRTEGERGRESTVKNNKQKKTKRV